MRRRNLKSSILTLRINIVNRKEGHFKISYLRRPATVKTLTKVNDVPRKDTVYSNNISTENIDHWHWHLHWYYCFSVKPDRCTIWVFVVLPAKIWEQLSVFGVVVVLAADELSYSRNGKLMCNEPKLSYYIVLFNNNKSENQEKNWPTLIMYNKYQQLLVNKLIEFCFKSSLFHVILCEH